MVGGLLEGITMKRMKGNRNSGMTMNHSSRARALLLLEVPLDGSAPPSQHFSLGSLPPVSPGRLPSIAATG